MEPLKIGVLGVSRHYGLRMHKPVMDSPFVEAAAIGSRQLVRAAAAAKEWGFKRAYGSYQELVDDPDVEAVYIPLSNDLHAEWIRRCADAGKAVLCEKPVALNALEAADAFDYAEKKGVLAMEAFMYKFHPQWIKAKEVVEAGEIGRIMAIHTIFSFYNDDPDNIRNRKDVGGGALYDIGCYAISSARFLLNREPVRVTADIEYDPALGVDILTSAMMDFGGSQALFTVSTRMAPRQTVAVYGSQGYLRVVRPFNAYTDVPLTLVVDDGDGPREIQCGPIDQYGAMLEAFARAYRQGGPPPIPGSDAIANMKVIDAVFRSSGGNGWVGV